MPKFYRVATEGATIDGRVIKREYIEQMAKNYDPDKYAARVWLEHQRSLMPDGSFKAYGDVKALKTEKNADGKLVLLAEIEASDDLKEINKKSQKLYSSIEINPNFSDSGEAYLVGLAVTDSPASIGTERLKFSALMQPTHLFSGFHFSEFDFSDVEQNEPAANNSILSKIKEMFTQRETAHQADYQAFHKDVSDSMVQIIEDYNAQFATLKQTSANLAAEVAALKQQFADVGKKLDTTPSADYTARPTADGTTEASFETDC